mmetsp:Transcript_27413/g.59913  ORF Transcript_27413/g.59913 Transcript_27413/m.59913 type:complete len:280 (-) Transcript_27413:680-1519(-)
MGDGAIAGWRCPRSCAPSLQCCRNSWTLSLALRCGGLTEEDSCGQWASLRVPAPLMFPLALEMVACSAPEPLARPSSTRAARRRKFSDASATLPMTCRCRPGGVSRWTCAASSTSPTLRGPRQPGSIRCWRPSGRPSRWQAASSTTTNRWIRRLPLSKPTFGVCSKELQSTSRTGQDRTVQTAATARRSSSTTWPPGRARGRTRWRHGSMSCTCGTGSWSSCCSASMVGRRGLRPTRLCVGRRHRRLPAGRDDRRTQAPWTTGHPSPASHLRCDPARLR